MTEQFLPSSNRKDLSDLQRLPRSPVLSYLQKQAQPKSPRHEAPAPQTTNKIFPSIGSYSPSNLWAFVSDYFRHRLGRRYPFQTYAAGQANGGVYTMPADAEIRIALAGDWATGTDEAAAIANLITAFQPHYSIHLGDVYYVGDPVEVGENFLGIPNPDNNFTPCRWPSGTEATFALNGNHEMYSLGTAYFTKMLPALGRTVAGRIDGQFASFFCLENEFWRLIAVDTGYNSIGMPVVEYFWPPDSSLPDALLDWLRNTVKPRSDDPRGIIIMSHHQYFSGFEQWYPKPAQQLAEFFSRPVLWFWGHEHRMAIYDKFAAVGGITAFGRCIGHGGMPVELPPADLKHPECVVEFVDSRVYLNDENLVIGFNGFAKMSLNQDRMNVDYVDVRGTPVYSETWSARDGVLTRIASGAVPAPELIS
jgi:Calcineurin-like phosphoesterase